MSSPQPNIPLELRPDHPAPAHPSHKTLVWETLVSAAIMGVGAAMAFGAVSISSEAGYGGVGANFLPWLVAIALMVCGAVLLYEARTGGYRAMEEVAGDEHPDWINFVWVSAGLLLNAALIEHIGFILSCALAYVLAVQGLRRAYGKPHNTWVVDALGGLAIAAPVYWLFTKFLAINLPGLTTTGWI
ncbi:tripartite tricarboxylate transporter TctB family protein [Ottowia testudinis]|uniref:Tripartite tricarboxylate transporter TctB family protein n=1 Tax=Ottowia testudinis TaxID=2816950 RepID=A0A975CMM0_9BURK|nr:tripartite tricarboxylate transporter TctB family protein [Ottowia testudinis]QTD46273.1 tripartite tricarboxylate transporter TctB family protein [Ottowia testudinis]